MIERLLVPVDGTDFSESAVAQSVALAHQLGARIVGFVVEPTMGLPNLAVQPAAYIHQTDTHEARTEAHAQEVLKRFEDVAVAAQVPFRGAFARATNVEEAIVQGATENECDMIVMTTHGRGAFGEMLFGSHTKGVLSRTKLPVLVLH